MLSGNVLPPSRLIPLAIGVSTILGLVIWLIDSIIRLYTQVAWTSPFLGNVLILLILALLGFLIYAFIYYFHLSQPTSKRRQSRPIQLPAEKNRTAEAQIQALQSQVAQIQDQVAQQALLQKAQTLRANLERGQLKIVVFGSGAAGKTALVNALLGQRGGEVAPTMGTTVEGQNYYLAWGLDRELCLTDTPGILEPGVVGTEREQMSRQLAAQADLLLFVVDNDLRHSEYEPLAALLAIGKRSLLVLNKKDLYTTEEVETLLQTLRQRVQSFLAPQDVVAIAASPADVQIQTGLRVKPDPDIAPLVKRLVSLLQAEGEDLIADNILLQSQSLGQEVRRLIDRQRYRSAERIINRYQWIGAGVIAATPVPVVDMLATAAVNAQMVVEIGQVYGCELDPERGKELAFSLGKTLVSLGLVKGAIEVLAQALQLQMTTYLVGKALQGVTAAYLTRIAGKSFRQYFSQNQDWGDGGISEVVQKQFQLSRKNEFIQTFVQEAISQVVQPWSQWWAPEASTPLPDLAPLTQLKAELIADTELELEPIVKQPYSDWESPNLRREDW